MLTKVFIALLDFAYRIDPQRTDSRFVDPRLLSCAPPPNRIHFQSYGSTDFNLDVLN